MTRGGGVNSVMKLGLSQTVGEFLDSWATGLSTPCK